VAYRGGLGNANPLEIPKALQNRAKLNPIWKLLKIAEFRTPTPQDIRIKGSKILKLPPVRNCFTLAMTNKLVVIINSLKVPKIKKISLYEMKFLLPNYTCFQNPWIGGYRPQIPVLSVLCPQLNLLKPPQNKIPGHATVSEDISVPALNCRYKLASLSAAADKFDALIGQTISLKSRNGVLT